METYNYDPSAQAGSEARTAENESAVYHRPGSGSVSDPNTAPGFGPAGPVTPSLPGNTGGCINCGGSNWKPSPNGALWTWGILSPFFSTSSEIAHLRFYNAASIREPIDIYLNGRLVVSDLDYMNYTRYMHIIPGIYQLTVYRRTNPGFAIVNTNIRLRSGYSYTLAVLGTFNDFSVQMLNA